MNKVLPNKLNWQCENSKPEEGKWVLVAMVTCSGGYSFSIANYTDKYGWCDHCEINNTLYGVVSWSEL